MKSSRGDEVLSYANFTLNRLKENNVEMTKSDSILLTTQLHNQLLDEEEGEDKSDANILRTTSPNLQSREWQRIDFRSKIRSGNHSTFMRRGIEGNRDDGDHHHHHNHDSNILTNDRRVSSDNLVRPRSLKNSKRPVSMSPSEVHSINSSPNPQLFLFSRMRDQLFHSSDTQNNKNNNDDNNNNNNK